LIRRNSISLTTRTLASLLLAFAYLGIAPAVWAQTVAGSISAMSGSASITRGKTTIPAANGNQVEVGDRIVTGAGSNVTVKLTDGSQIEVTDSSDLTIDQNTLNPDGTRASTKVSLLSGLVRSLVRTTPGTPPNFEVHTPNAVASARGTNYDVDHQTGVQNDKFPGCKEFSHVSVFEGTVTVSNPTNPSSPAVDVKQGQKVTVPCGAAPILGTAAAASAGLSAASIGALGALGAAAITTGALAASGGLGGGGSGGGNSVVSPSQ
jgi:ferric-dicitrate binding protein FerR (iron transport regulator)